MKQVNLWLATRAMLRRDILLAMRRKADVLTSLFFFLIAVSLFPLGVGPQPDTLRLIGPGVIWVAALLAAMLSLGRMFSDDYQDGTLEHLLLLPHPLSVMVLSKILAHWLLSGLPLVIFSPLLGMQLGLPSDAIVLLMITLLLGTPALSLIGAVGAALTIGVRGGGVLVSLLVLPLYIPILIFGAGAVEAQNAGLGTEAHLSILGAFFMLTLVFAPISTAAALRISLD